MDHGLNVKYTLAQMGYWALYATSFVYMTPLLQARGFSAVQIGIFNAARYVAVIVFQVLLAWIIDRYFKYLHLKKVIAGLSALSFAATLVLYFGRPNFKTTLVIFLIFGATINCILPLLESLSIQYMHAGRRLTYTVARAWGSGTWAVVSLLLGIIVAHFGVEQMLSLQLLCATGLFGVVLTLDDLETDPQLEVDSDQPATYQHLLTHYPQFLLFLGAVVFMFMAYDASSLFMIDAVRRVGGNNQVYGWIQAVLAFSEIPIAIGFIKVQKRWSIDELMFAAALFNTIKAAGIAFAPNALLLMISQISEGLGLAIFYVGTIYFVKTHLPKVFVVKANSLINVAAVGIGEAVSSLTSGQFKTQLGLHGLLLISVGYGLLSILLMACVALFDKIHLPVQQKSLHRI